MALMWISIVLAVGIQIINGASILTRQQSASPGPLCETAAYYLGQYLEYKSSHDPLSDSVPFTYREFVFKLFGRDMYIRDVREETLCHFEDLDRLSQLRDAFGSSWLDLQSLKFVYSYMLFAAEMVKNTVEQMAHHEGPQIDTTISYIDKLITDMEASGLWELDPHTAGFIRQVLEAFFDSTYSPWDSAELQPIASPSSLSRDDQCAQLGEDIVQFWNASQSMAALYDPDAPERNRQKILNWTGIDMNDHRRIRQVTCDIFEYADDSGIYGVLLWTWDSGVVNRVTKTGYPLVVATADELIESFVPNGNDGMINAGKFLETLSAMNLFNLYDDL